MNCYQRFTNFKFSGGESSPPNHDFRGSAWPPSPCLRGSTWPPSPCLGGQLRWPPSSSFRGSGHWPPSMNDTGWISLKSTHAGDRERANPSTLTPYTLYVFLENDGLIALTTLVFQQLWSTLSADHRSLPRTFQRFTKRLATRQVAYCGKKQSCLEQIMRVRITEDLFSTVWLYTMNKAQCQ